MPTDQKIKLEIEATATGDGAKTTADQIEKLRKGSNATAEQAKKLREEIDKIDDESGDAQRALRGVGDELENISRKAAESADAAEELVRDMGGMEDESGEAEQSLKGVFAALEKVSKEADKTAKKTANLARDMGKVDDAAKKVRSTTNRANESIGKVPAASNAAAKSQKNLGLATLSASQGLEDMQFGIRGVLNNIPPLVLQLGGGAGLAGAISILAVSATVLAPLLQSQGEIIKLNARIAEEAADKRVAAAARERRAIRENAEELDSYQVVLEEEVNQVSRNLKAISDLSAARSRAHAHQQAVRDAELGLEIAVIQNDDGLSDLDKILAIEKAKKEKARRDQVEAELNAQQELQAEKNKLESGEESFSRVADENRSNIFNLNREIEARTKQADKLQESLEEVKKTLDEVSIPALDKLVNAEGQTNFLKAVINPIGNNGTLFAPDRKDFDTNEAFLSKVEELLTPVISPEAEGLTKTKKAFDAVKAQVSTNSKSEEVLALERSEIELLKEKREALEAAGKSAIQMRNAEAAASMRRIELQKEEIANIKELNKINNQTADEQSQSVIKSTVETNITKEVAELGRTLEHDFQQQESTVKEVAQARAQYDRIEQLNRQALEDGFRDAGEQQAIALAIADFRRTFTAQSKATLTNFNELTAAVKAQAQVSAAQSQSIKTLQQTLQSR